MLKQLLKFGIGTIQADRRVASLKLLVDVFDRNTEIDGIGALAHSVSTLGERTEHGRTLESLKGAAIVLDTNVVLRIPLHRSSADIIDYIKGHEGPIVLPGQVVQEFWNNELAVIETAAKKLKKSFDSFRATLTELKLVDDIRVGQIESMVDDFEGQYGVLYLPETQARVRRFIDMLMDKCIAPFAPRDRLMKLAADRKASKTPPGFHDSGSGDFLVWADAMYGLLSLEDREGLRKVILLTNEKKSDWVRGDIVHPVLVAEAKALLGVSLEAWSVDDLAKAIAD